MSFKINLLTVLSLLGLALTVQGAVGVGSTGGANSIDGRLTESYRVQPEQLPGYRDIVIPTILKTKASSPEFGDELESNLYHLAWYIVPVPLNQLPFTQNGVPFPSDQDVVQTDGGEVWISQTAIDQKPSEFEKGKTIIHELVMAEIFKETDNPGVKEHGRVRRLTDTLMREDLTADTLKEEIYNDGFKNSVENVTPFYTLFEANPNLTGRGVILSRRESQFAVKVCSADALSGVHSKMERFNKPEFPGFQPALSRAFNNQGCQSIENKTYVVTSENLNNIMQTRNMIAIGSRGVDVLGGMLSLLSNPFFSNLPMSLKTFGITTAVEVVIAVGTYYYNKHKLAPLQNVDLSFQSQELVHTGQNPDELALLMTRGFHGLAAKGYGRIEERVP